MSIYLEYEDIKGNIMAERHKDNIGILSIQFGVGRDISMEPGNRKATRPYLRKITISKFANNSSIFFQKGC
ncbi:MAG: hypothetical protein EOO53_10725 [Gammaproteobacteria bacterium]|nr:MAG: hypothetical protein EOO53_10725 [Gammaproteobacteria bacterium]